MSYSFFYKREIYLNHYFYIPLRGKNNVKCVDRFCALWAKQYNKPHAQTI